MLHYTVAKIKGPKGYGAAVVMGHKVYALFESSRNIDVHVFNTVSLVWVKLPTVTPGTGERHLEVPSSRRRHTAVLVEDIIYIWGGWTNPGYCNVLYAYDVDAHTWFKPRVSGTIPEGRDDHSACVSGKVMFIYGGRIGLTGYNNDIYKLDTTTMVWSLINTRGTLPPASDGHSSTIIGTKMFVFRGGGDYDNISMFDTETNSWQHTPSAQLLPERRWGHSAFVYNGELYIFGGCRYGHKILNDLWKFNPENFSWKTVEPKGKGLYPMFRMCCCMVGDRIFLFGGYKEHASNDDLSILDLSPSLKTLCKLAVFQYDLEQSELPHNIRWELAAMMN